MSFYIRRQEHILVVENMKEKIKEKGKKKIKQIRTAGKKWFGALLRRRMLIIVLLLIQIVFFIYFLLSGSLASEIIHNCLNIISLAVLIHVVATDRSKGAYKLTWALLILIFPVFGGVFYIILNVQSSTKWFQRRIIKTEAKANKCRTMFNNGYDSAKENIPQYAPQITYLQNCAGFPVYNNSRAVYFKSGEDKLERLLTELEKAEKYIFLEYFIVQEGKMWDSILEILKRKAAAGVKVRFMYDDLGCFFLLPKDYPEELKKFGIECVVFNPFRPILSVVQNNRDHRKIVSIDGKVCFTGGVNLADEYINEIERYGHWKDSAIMVEGDAAWSFTIVFLQMWEVCTGIDEDYLIYCPEKTDIGNDGFIQPFADSPLDDETVGEHVYMQIISNAKKYVYINTPYLIIDENIVSALKLAAKSGVDVRIVTPHVWDKLLVHITTCSYYYELIKSGVKIYEYTKGFNHAKSFVADDETAVVGTINLDYRSLYLHFECGVQIYDNSAIKDIKQDYLNSLKVCHQVSAEECRKNVFIQFLQDVLRLFAPLM